MTVIDFPRVSSKQKTEARRVPPLAVLSGVPLPPNAPAITIIVDDFCEQKKRMCRRTRSVPLPSVDMPEERQSAINLAKDRMQTLVEKGGWNCCITPRLAR